MNSSIRKLRLATTWALEQVVILVVAALVLDVLWGVVTRFLLGSPSRWTEEVATFLLIWVSLLGAAVAFARHEHLGVDYFVKKLDPTAQRASGVVVQLAIIAFTCAAMIFGGYVLVSETLKAGQTTPALGIRMGYVYLAVPVSGVFIVLYALERIAELLIGDASTTGSESHGYPGNGHPGNENGE